MKIQHDTVVAGKTITHRTLASLDGAVWGVIAEDTQYHGPNSPVGHSWEAAINGQSDYNPLIAQVWYGSWEKAITANPA